MNKIKKAPIKNQHYVSQFYLRNFSCDNKNINIFVVKSLTHKQGPIDKQCSEDYFYDEDNKIETKLLKEIIEDAASPSIEGVLLSKKLWPRNSREYEALTAFVLLQHARTKASGNENQEMMSNILKETYIALQKIETQEADKIRNHKMRLKHPANLNILSALLSSPFINDLKGKILVNNTALEFITSDNPVVFFNSFFNKYIDGPTAVISKRGFQIFCPLSPEVMFVLFDPDLYHFGKCHEEVILITKEDDVAALNSLQYLNCNKTLYYRTDSDYQKKNIDKLKKLLSSRPEKKVIINRVLKKGEEGILSLKNEFKFKLELSFLKHKKFNENTLALFSIPRIPIEIIEIYRSFTKLVSEDKLRPEDWNKYLDNFCSIAEKFGI